MTHKHHLELENGIQLQCIVVESATLVKVALDLYWENDLPQPFLKQVDLWVGEIVNPYLKENTRPVELCQKRPSGKVTIARWNPS
ncbi:MAG: hypothetical protein EHM40_21310 [Chloroflexi bacterium]|nr:MAG: hypothetical protein EHM40_21310 [Chloroflexota bacterium]